MRVFISVDMEGVAGVVHERQTDPTDPSCASEYQQSRLLMTGEANAAVEGALGAGATSVLVNDSHWLMRNLVPDGLHPAAELVSGSPKPLSMMQGISAECAAAIFIGYHARAGTGQAVIDHTYTDRIHEVRVNNRAVGELALNAAIAGTMGVPVALISGDQAVALEAEEVLGASVERIIVKHAVSRYAARNLSPAAAGAAIREGVQRALGRRHTPFTFDLPVTIETTFARSVHADMAALLPGCERIDGRTVTIGDSDYLRAFSAWRAMYNLAGME